MNSASRRGEAVTGADAMSRSRLNEPGEWAGLSLTKSAVVEAREWLIRACAASEICMTANRIERLASRRVRREPFRRRADPQKVCPQRPWLAAAGRG